MDLRKELMFFFDEKKRVNVINYFLLKKKLVVLTYSLNSLVWLEVNLPK